MGDRFINAIIISILMGIDNSAYFEGVLQLRNVGKEVLDYAVKQIENNMLGGVARLKKTEKGFDVYVKRQRFLRTLGNNLQKKFAGELIVSRKLHTRNRISSKDLYRIHVLFRMHDYKKGDIMEFKGEKVQIIYVGKKILAKEIKTGKKLNLSFKLMKSFGKTL
jgi:NMD protein affecting ribosome stability and mRNA decay